MKFLLVPFGLTYTVLLAGVILIPYFRRKGHLFTTWNIFLAGLANFVGIATFQSGVIREHLYGTFDAADYIRFMLGATVFTVTALLTYKFVTFPTRLGTVRLQKWMAPRRTALIAMGVFSAVFTVISIAGIRVQFIGQILSVIGFYGSIFATAFAFVVWYRQPANLPLLLLTCFSFLAALAFLLAVTISRRDYLDLILVIPITTYWAFFRYRAPTRVFGPLAAVAVVGFLLITGISVLRWMVREEGNPVVVAINEIKQLPKLALDPNADVALLGGDTTEASLVAIHRFTNDAPPEPFFTVIYVSTNWIPRAWYPNKVGSLGEALPRDIGYWTMHGYVSWGAGIVGHGYHEGGTVMLAFYGFVLGAAFKFFDTLLIRQHGNVVAWAILASVSGQIFALSRGEFGLFIVLILGGLFAGLTLNAVGRRIFGTVDYRTVDPDAVQALMSARQADPASAARLDPRAYEDAGQYA